MAIPVSLSIPSPCSESWAAMTPNAAGRHCAACQQTVADFTRMSDAEILTYLGRHPTVSCGRFRDNQLSRPLLVPAQPLTGRRLVGAAAALWGVGALVAPKAQGQQIPPAFWGGPASKNVVLPNVVNSTSTEAIDSLSEASALPSFSVVSEANQLIIRGTLHSAKGKTIRGMKVDLVARWETEVSTVTDANGNFQFTVNRDSLGESPFLSVMHYLRLGLYYQYANADIDVASSQPYRLQLSRTRKKHRMVAGKFR
ncbi:hypothetical protein [Hymenobacter rubidus]|uniref:hypothetical protein n=1 Tax=Hymenobacter rubidus TaxID=1441626 RepID=UPI00191FC418|nr:hypothetical protein [Hymenobacter rubidus]